MAINSSLGGSGYTVSLVAGTGITMKQGPIVSSLGVDGYTVRFTAEGGGPTYTQATENVTFDVTQFITDEGSETYASTSSGTSNTAHGRAGGILNAGMDGWLEVQYPATGDAACMVGFDATINSTLAYGSCDYICSANTAGALSVGTNASSLTATGYTMVPGVGTRLRLRRLAGTMTVETSQDSGTTWTVRHTFGGSSTGALIPHFYTTYSVTPRRIYQPRQRGLVPGIGNSMQGQWVAPNVAAVGSVIYVGSAGTAGEQRVSRLVSGVPTTATLATYEVDDHNVPAIIELASGKMLALYARHSLVPTLYNHISTSVNAADWGVQRTVTASDTATYMQVWRATGQTRVWMMYRVGVSDEGNWAIRYTDDEGTSWSAEVIFAPNTYIISVLAEDGFTLRCFGYDHPVAGTNHDIYLFYINLLTGAVTDSAGTALGNVVTPTGMPLTRAQQHKVVDVTDPTSTRMYEPGKVGVPAVMASEFASSLQGTYSRYTYSTTTGLFTKSEICTSGPAFFASTSNYFGGCCFGASLDEVYAARNLGASVGVGDWELARYTYAAGVWTKASIARRTTNIIARPQVKAGRLWWSEVSSYPAFTNFQATLHSLPVA